MKNTKNNLLREVSLSEYYGMHVGTVVSRSKIIGNIPIKIFQEALEIISRRHPFLTSVLFNHGNKIFYKKIKKIIIPLKIMENINTEMEKDNLYINELNSILNPYEQLWRVLLILETTQQEINENSNVEMILTLQHCICDGTSLLNLVEEIMKQINALQNGKQLYEKQPLPLFPSFEDILIKHKALKKENYIVSMHEKNFDRIEPDFSMDKDRCKIMCLRERFSQPETNALVAKCRALEITVHAVVCAAMLKSIADEINHPKRELRLRLRHAIDLRRRYSFLPGKEHLLSCATVEPITTIYSNFDILVLSKQILKELNNKLQQTNGLELMNSIMTCHTYQDLFQLPAIPGSFGISNVGRVDIPAEYNHFRLSETDFIASGKFPSLFMSITTFNNAISYILLYTLPWFKKDTIEKVNNCFKYYLSDFFNS